MSEKSERRELLYFLIFLLLLLLLLSPFPLLIRLPPPYRNLFWSMEFFFLGFFLSLLLFTFTRVSRTLFLRSTSPLSFKGEEVASSLLTAQREIIQLNRRLEEELRIRNEELRKIRSELLSLQMELIEQEKLASLAKMAAGVVHEIRNPLSIIRTSSYLIRNSLEGTSSQIGREKVIEQLEQIEREVARINEIATSLLEYSKTSQEIPVEWVDAVTLVGEILKGLEEEGKLEKVRVENNLSSDLPPVSGNKERLREVFLNIINNALEAMEEGEIRIWGRKDERRVSLYFQDTGPGIPQENLKFIFDPFFTTKEKGFGLGLAISYALIKRFKGDIRVSSEVGKGTTFEVILPAKV